MATQRRITSTTDAPTTVARLREQIAALRTEAAAIATAPLPLVEADGALVDTVDRLAATYNPDPVLAEFSRSGAPSIATVQLLLGDPRYDVQNFQAFLAAAFREPLLTMWRARVRAQYEADPELARVALPIAERPARLAQLREQIHALELDEEKVIAAGERAGIRIDRRGDLDVAVLFDPAVLAEAMP